MQNIENGRKDKGMSDNCLPFRPAFKEADQLREGQVSALNRYRQFLACILNAQVQQFERAVIVRNAALVFVSLRNWRCTASIELMVQITLRLGSG
jgi:hypothetical protein